MTRFSIDSAKPRINSEMIDMPETGMRRMDQYINLRYKENDDEVTDANAEHSSSA